MFFFIPALIFLILTSCSTQKYDIYNYVVKEKGHSYLCDKLIQETLDKTVALDCEHILNGTKLDKIINPVGVIIIKE